jgi:hypothetical protein
MRATTIFRRKARGRRTGAGGALALLLLALVLASCAAERDAAELFGPSEADLVVVESVLIVDAPLPAVRVSRSVPPDRAPTDDDVESDAVVIVRSPAGEFPYAESASLPGTYFPVSPEVVRPETEYRLEVTTTRGEVVTARTITPPRLDVEAWVVLNDDLTVNRTLRTYDEAGEAVYAAPENRLVYAKGLLEVRYAPVESPALQLGLLSLDPESDFVIDPAFFEEEDFADLERANSSPALDASGGFVRLPWFSVFFEGRYVFRIFAIDENWYDFIRSDPELAAGGPGFGGNAGDAFERPIFHVNGGIGLFASAAADSVGFRIVPAP